MSTPDSSGDILRAIARSYREELGPARAEQLVSRAMARAGTRVPRSRAMRLLAPTAALAVTLLAVGLVLLVGDGSPAPDPDPQAPVAAPAAPEETVAEVAPSPVVSIPKEELEQALALINQQKELDAAEVVVRALSAIFPPVIAGSGEQNDSPPSTAAPEAEQTPPLTSSAAGGTPPEQATYPQGTSSGTAGSAESETESGDSDPPSDVTETQPTIEELGQVLKVEVEELLSADPEDLAEAAEEARDAATPILEYGEGPTILLPNADDQNGATD